MSFKFTPSWKEPYRQSPYRLRFELGGKLFGTDMPVPRFAQAFDRARILSEKALESSAKIFGLVAFSKEPSLELFSPSKDPLLDLRNAGFSSEPVSCWEAPFHYHPEEDEPIIANWRAFDLTDKRADRDVLIWCAVAREMGVRPTTPILSYLLDPDRGVLVYVYDDRGMDLTSLNREELSSVYETQSDWLLSYDRERMADAFEAVGRSTGGD